jgi:hypothetical protein
MFAQIDALQPRRATIFAGPIAPTDRARHGRAGGTIGAIGGALRRRRLS